MECVTANGPSLKIQIGLHPQALQGSWMVGFLGAELLAGGGQGQISTSVESFSIKNNTRDQVNSGFWIYFQLLASTLAGRPTFCWKVWREICLLFHQRHNFFKVANTLFLSSLRSTKSNVWSPPESYFNVVICSLPQRCFSVHLSYASLCFAHCCIQRWQRCLLSSDVRVSWGNASFKNEYENLKVIQIICGLFKTDRDTL